MTRARDMSDEELEQRRQRDVDSGAMAYGETASSREQARRQPDEQASIKQETADYHHIACTIDIQCAECGDDLKGTTCWMSTGPCYCDECADELDIN